MEVGVVVFPTFGTLNQIPITVDGFVILGKAFEAMPKLTQHVKLSVDFGIQKHIATIQSMEALAATVVTTPITLFRRS